MTKKFDQILVTGSPWMSNVTLEGMSLFYGKTHTRFNASVHGIVNSRRATKFQKNVSQKNQHLKELVVRGEQSQIDQIINYIENECRETSKI